jgi:RNA polymerase sigma factor (TIGR02999 family)
MSTTSAVAQALEAWRAGDSRARDAVFALTYEELRAIARRHLARMHPGQTLAPTILVHEAYVKFSERSAPHVLNREHFLGIAARAMRHIVVDHIRRRSARKRDGGKPITLDDETGRAAGTSTIDVLALDEALTALEALDPRQVKVVELRFFAGLDLAEIARALDVSERTAKRDWHKARAFLFSALR